MSSRPLISHHLFVAAVKEKRRVLRVRGRTRTATSVPQAREIPLELVDFGRPSPLETASAFDPFRRVVST